MSVSEDTLITHDARQAEVAELDVLIGVEEDVPRLQVSVQDFVTFFSHVALQQS